MLLYGDEPPAGEPTLEMVRSPLPADGGSTDEARAVLGKLLARWGWDDRVDEATGCITTILRALEGSHPESLELWALRRQHQLTVELHYAGGDARFHELVGAAGPLRTVDMLAHMWGVRPMNDGEAVWFEFRVD
jgi:hypothetical protein